MVLVKFSIAILFVLFAAAAQVAILVPAPYHVPCTSSCEPVPLTVEIHGMPQANTIVGTDTNSKFENCLLVPDMDSEVNMCCRLVVGPPNTTIGMIFNGDYRTTFANHRTVEQNDSNCEIVTFPHSGTLTCYAENAGVFPGQRSEHVIKICMGSDKVETIMPVVDLSYNNLTMTENRDG